MYVSKVYKYDNDKSPIPLNFKLDGTYENQLNSIKMKLDDMPIKANIEIGKIEREYEDVRHIIMDKYNGQNISNGSMKLIEILYTFKNLISKERDIISFHNAELPGGFITGLNHFLFTENKSKINWKWYANSLVGYPGFDDYYKLCGYNKNNWMMDENNDGDLCNYVSIKNAINKFLGLCPNGCDLYTSDLGTNEMTYFLFQEETLFKPQFCQLLMAIDILNINGNLIFKQYTFFELSTIKMLYYISKFFKEFLICKPLTSRSGNSENYGIFIGFKGINNDVKN